MPSKERPIVDKLMLKQGWDFFRQSAQVECVSINVSNTVAGGLPLIEYTL